jgi:hypothetical protein
MYFITYLIEKILGSGAWIFPSQTHYYYFHSALDMKKIVQ